MPCRDNEQTFFPGGIGHCATVCVSLQTDHIACAADTGNMRGVFLGECLECFMPDCALALYFGEEVLFLYNIENGIGSGTSQRVASKGGAMRSGLEKDRVGCGYPDGTDGKSPAPPSCHAHGVGPDAGGFVGEEVPGTSDAALNFIENQKCAAFITKCTEFTKKTGFCGKDTAFTLNGFDEYRGCGIVDQPVKAFYVIEFAETKAIQHGMKSGLNFLLWCGGHASKGAAVKGIVCTYDMVAASFLVIALAATVQSG